MHFSTLEQNAAKYHLCSSLIAESLAAILDGGGDGAACLRNAARSGGHRAEDPHFHFSDDDNKNGLVVLRDEILRTCISFLGAQ